tara:strand:- start:90241 stop:93156 length:2916 start_codon:yes stop_codon:yes gene_type:complete
MMNPESDFGSDSAAMIPGLDELTTDQQRRLTNQLDQYLRALEEGEPIDLSELNRRNPDLKDIFTVYLHKLDTLYGAAASCSDNPAAATSLANHTSNLSMTLGDFKLLREIGRGGMGVVYEARQESLRRNVAIKLLSMSSVLDPRQISRFRNEAHTAGSLNHPNIVSVHSVGSQRGMHYYAMPLIDGTSIDTWVRQKRLCDPTTDAQRSPHENGDESAAHRPSSRGTNTRHPALQPLEFADHRHQGWQSSHQPSPRPPLPDWKTVVDWSIDIADALHCAHQAGVVHRDVKPSNLLVDRNNKIWITDFGLALCQNSHSLTRSGDLIGTMRYMSPEQASGKRETIDHRTDIYSLGATLFEMLTLRPAILGDDGPGLLRTIESDQPPRLRDHRPDAPRDLSVVLQKAMAKRKDDRYESAEQFADDLRAVLAGRPTIAKPLSLSVWMTRWMLHHRRVVLGGALLLLVALTWLTASSFIINQQIKETQFAQQSRDLLRRQAHHTVDQLGSQVAQQLASIPGTEHVRRSLLDKTLAYYEQFAVAASGDPKLQAELAITHSRIGSLVSELNAPSDAIEHYRKSAERFHALMLAESQEIGQTTSAKIAQPAAQNLNQLALALAARGDTNEAADRYREAIAIQKSLIKDSPQNVRLATELAVTANNLGMLLQDTGEEREAISILDQAVTHLSKLVDNDENNELANRGLSAALTNLAVLRIEHEPKQSIALLSRALKLRLQSIETSTNRLKASAEIAAIYGNLGSAYLKLGNEASSEQSFAHSVGLLKRLTSIAPLVMQHRANLAMNLNNLAIAQQKQGLHTSATIRFREAIETQSACIDAFAPESKSWLQHTSRLAAIRHNLATSLVALAQYDQAEAALLAAIADQRSVLRKCPDMRDARSCLHRHYADLLRCQIRNQRWDAIRSTAEAYQASAGDDERLLNQFNRDIEQANQLVPSLADRSNHFIRTDRATNTRENVTPL